MIYNIQNLEKGMVVRQNVVAPNGQVILEEGTILNDNNLVILAKYKIEFVEVEDSDKRTSRYTEEEFKKIRMQVEQRLGMLFKDCLNDKYMHELYSLVCDVKFIEILNEQ